MSKKMKSLVNEAKIYGKITDITFKSNKVMIFYLLNETNKRNRKVKITCFKTEYFEMIEVIKNLELTIESIGEIYESRYLDKNTNEWNVTYTVVMDQFDLIGIDDEEFTTKEKEQIKEKMKEIIE